LYGVVVYEKELKGDINGIQKWQSLPSHSKSKSAYRRILAGQRKRARAELEEPKRRKARGAKGHKGTTTRLLLLVPYNPIY
jgi:hypothetical protein